MAVVTIYRLAEECLKVLGEMAAATAPSISEVKIAIGQVINAQLKTEYLSVNLKRGESIPNGVTLGLYEGVSVTSNGNGKSLATMPITPIKLPRNLGLFSVFRTNAPDDEFIPVQTGQGNLLRGQPLISDLLGQIYYEPYGNGKIIISKDIPLLYPGETLSMRLAIMDISEYDDYDPLPIPADMEYGVKMEVVKMFSGGGITDKLVDSSTKQNQNIPLNQQKQA
jgi:hypothetical protein